MPTKQFLINQLATLADVKPDSIRYYERKGLLPKPQRKASGYRVYDDAALRQLHFIKKAQAFGFSLDEIHRVLGLRGHGKETCRCVIAIAEATLSETEERLKDLREFQRVLKKNLARWRRSAGRSGVMAAQFCALIESAAPPHSKAKDFVHAASIPTARHKQR